MTQRDDLVKQLKAVDHESVEDCFLQSPLFAKAAARIEAQEAEIAGRDTFIKELSDALLSIRPLGGSELFVKRFGKHYADPAYCEAAIEERTKQYHEAMKTAVRNDKRANQAESALAKAVEVMRAVGHIGVDFGYGEYVLEDRFIQAARDFVKEHAKP